MFGKILRAGKGGHGLKYKIDVQVTQLENLPTSIKKCRVVWARSAKMQITDIKDVRGSVASFKQTLTQVTTIYRDKSGKMEAKEYEFKVQVPGKNSSDTPVTIGKASHDMAKYCRDENTTQNAMIPIPFKVGGTTTGYLKMVITTVFLGDANEDGLTEVSGITGLTSDHGSVREQDLDGFGDDEHAKFSKRSKSRRDDGSGAGTSGRSSKPESSRHRKPLPPTAEEDASDLEEEPQPEVTLPAAKASRKKPHARQQPEGEAEEEEANPFARKVAKPANKKVQPKVWEDDEDVSPLNSDISDSEPPKPTGKAKASTKSKEPDESLDGMKASLFSTKKTASPSGRGAAAAAATAATSAAGPSSSKPISSKAGKASTPPPVDDEDDDSLRNDLFTTKPRNATAAAAGKSGPGKAAGVAAAAGAALATAEVASAASKHKSKAAPPPPPEDEDEDYDDYGPSVRDVPPPAAATKARSRAVEAPEASTVKSSSALARAGSSKGGAAELEQLRQRAVQLEQQLADEQAAKSELSKKMQKYVDKIADLEDQLAEGDVTELFTQMREMEAKHQAEIKDMEAMYQDEVKELMARHLAEMEEIDERHRTEIAELQEAASSSGRGAAAGDEELKRLQSELHEQEILLKSRTAKLEAEHAAAITARQSGEAKLADANKMIDDSLRLATKHQQENKALQEEIARLKRQLEDVSSWDTSAAVVAATSAANNGRRNSEDEAELEELREKLEELQEENARLQKLNEVAQEAAAEMVSDIHVQLRDVRGIESFWNSTGSSQLAHLAVGVRCLCNAFALKSSELREAEVRLVGLSEKVSSSGRVSASGDALFADGASGGAGMPAKVKPHELLSRVQQVSAERDKLQEQLANQRHAHTELAAAQQLVEGLRQQVDQLTAEKAGLEQFKTATITDLRRQNDELRSSLRTLSSATVSPRTADEDASASETPGDVRAAFVGSAAARLAATAGNNEGNWHEFESLVAQLKADRADLRRQVELLKADKEQLKADKAWLGRQVEDMRSAGGAVAASAIIADASANRLMSRRQSGRDRADELELECSNLQEEVARLQAQLAELSEADTIIKEWSDYADGLLADKARLELQAEQLTRQLEAGAAMNDRRVEAAERRAEDWQRRAVDAEQKADESERKAQDAESRAAELGRKVEDANLTALEAERKAEDAGRRAALAEGKAGHAEFQLEDAERRAKDAERRADDAAAAAERAREESTRELAATTVAATAAAASSWQQQLQPADTTEVVELRHEISRLEASLSGLRVQLMETQSRTASAGGEVVSSSRALQSQRDGGTSNGELSYARGNQSDSDDAESSMDENVAVVGDVGAGPGHWHRGWHAEVEQLRTRNASLETTVAGLQASLAVASQQAGPGRTGSLPRVPRAADRELQDLQGRLSHALQVREALERDWTQEKAELESTVLLLRAELERAHIVQHTALDEPADLKANKQGSQASAGAAVARGVVAAATLPEVEALQREVQELEEEVVQVRNDRAMLSGTVSSLRLEVERLQEDKNDVEATINRLSTEMEELAEALEASNNENERLSMEVLSLRDQVDQLEAGEDAGVTRSQSMRSTRSARPTSSQGSEADGPASLQRGRSGLQAAERELAAARAAARELILQLEAGSNAGEGIHDKPGGLGDDDDLALALKALRAQILELQKQSRLQRQAPSSRTSSNAAAAAHAAAAAATEAQLAKASSRIDELEQLLEDAEIENQHLTEQLEECLTGGRKGPDSVGSVAEECQSSYGGSVAAGGTGTSNPYSYGHANMLTMSAFEQRLAMAEGRRDELTAALEESSATIRRLEADVVALQQQLSTVRRGQDPGTLGDMERSLNQVPSRSRGSRATSDTEDSFKKRVEELQAANRKLEAVCDDLEEKAQMAQERADKLQAELENATERLRGLEAAATAVALQKRVEEDMGGPSGRQAKDKIAALQEQLVDERKARQELEEVLKDKLDRSGDEEAAETVAAFQVKYTRLKERYKMLEESSQEEIDELQDQLADALSQIDGLQRQVKQLQSQSRSVASGATSSLGTANMEELRSLRSENERLVQQLVAKTMELAELSESEITIRRELTRLHEVNMKLAQKATTLEAQVAMAQAASFKNAKGGKK